MDIIGDPAVGHITVPDVPLRDWSGRVSRQADIRRTATAEVVDAELLARFIDPATSLRPFSAEFVIKHGFLVQGVERLIPFGTFRAEDFSWNESEDSFTMELNDRSRQIQRDSFGIPVDASGKLLSNFINDLFYDALPYAQLVIDSDVEDIRLPGGTTYRSGKLSAIHEACEAAGAEFFFDSKGVGRVTRVPFLDIIGGPGPQDWDVDVGDNGVLIKYQRAFSRKDAYNKILVYGAPKDQDTPQPYATAIDDDPSSATYYGGSFGKAELKIERQELLTVGQCQEYADAYLRNAIGLAKSIQLNSLSNHALEEGDVILATFPDNSQEFHMIDGYDISIDGSMTLQTRTRGIQE